MQIASLLRHASATLLAFGLLLTAVALPLQSQRGPAKRRPQTHAAPSIRAQARPAEKIFEPIAPLSPEEKQLSQLARALRDEGSAAAYTRLSEFAESHREDELGARAALALGYFDFTKSRQPQAAKWVDRAGRVMEKDNPAGLLREYALYWQAQVNRAQRRDAQAVAELETFRREFPESVQT